MSIDREKAFKAKLKTPTISKAEELAPSQRLSFLYIQLLERKKVLFRNYVTTQTASFLMDQDDDNAIAVGQQQLQEAKASMKALKWEIQVLQRLIDEHKKEWGDLRHNELIALGIEVPAGNFQESIEHRSKDEPEDEE